MARRKRTHDFPTIIHVALITRNATLSVLRFLFPFLFLFLDILSYPHVVDPYPPFVFQ